MASRLFSQTNQRFLVVVALTVLFSGAPLVHAQMFNSGSKGTDGALNLITPGDTEFDPVALGLDLDGDNVFHFTTITIGANVTVRMTARKMNRPVVWLATGAVQIDGTIDLNGETGSMTNSIPANRRPSIPGAGGYPGGVGALGSSSAQAGSGPGGGKPGAFGGGAGHVNKGDGQGDLGDSTYGNDFLVPLQGGSGGGGGNLGSGGAGGGALLLASSTLITVSGTIKADGGPNGTGNNGGGGGSGGSLRLMASSIKGGGTLSASGTPTSADNGGS